MSARDDLRFDVAELIWSLTKPGTDTGGITDAILLTFDVRRKRVDCPACGGHDGFRVEPTCHCE